MVLDALNVENSLRPLAPEPVPAPTWRAARTEDLQWAREFLVPWVLRRVRHQSSGDFITAKRPSAQPWHMGSEPGITVQGNATPEEIATAGMHLVVTND